MDDVMLLVVNGVVFLVLAGAMWFVPWPLMDPMLSLSLSGGFALVGIIEVVAALIAVERRHRRST